MMDHLYMSESNDNNVSFGSQFTLKYTLVYLDKNRIKYDKTKIKILHAIKYFMK